MIDSHEWSDTAAYREEDEFIHKMSGDEVWPNDFREWLGVRLAWVSVIVVSVLFFALCAACFWTGAAAFLLSGWGLTICGLAVGSIVASVVLLDRAQEGRS